MKLSSDQNFYDVLDVQPDCSSEEIRKAYYQLKSAFSKGNLASYSIYGSDESEHVVKEIDQAFEILSDPEKRRQYDQRMTTDSFEASTQEDDLKRSEDSDQWPVEEEAASTVNSHEDSNYGLAASEDSIFEDERNSKEVISEQIQVSDPPIQNEVKKAKLDTEQNGKKESKENPFSNVVSIDRIAPMEDSLRTAHLLVAPTTDFTSAADQDAGKTETQSHRSENSHSSLPSHQSTQPLASLRNTKNLETELDELIAQEKHWSGEFIQKVREARKISIEEMAEYTKISKRYLIAIEKEDFEPLPAAVYLRGFLIQISKKLKLPAEKVSASYVARFRQSCPDKA